MAVPIDHSAYECCDRCGVSSEALDRRRPVKQGFVAFDSGNHGRSMPCSADLAGFSLATCAGQSLLRAGRLTAMATDGLDFGDGRRSWSTDSDASDALDARLKPLLEDAGCHEDRPEPEIRHAGALRGTASTLAPLDDTMLMSYARRCRWRGGHGMDALCRAPSRSYLPISFKDVAGTGKAMVTFDKVPLDKATAYAAEDADVTLASMGAGPEAAPGWPKAQNDGL